MIDVDKVVAEAKKRRPWRVAGQMYRSFVPPVPGSFEWADIGEYVHVQHFDNLIAAIEQLQAELETVRCDEREKVLAGAANHVQGWGELDTAAIRDALREGGE